MAGIALRRSTVDDGDIIFRWRSEASTSAFQPTLPLSLSRVRAMLAERAMATVSPESTGKFQWVIEHDTQPVGWITLIIDGEHRRHGNGVIGYTIGEAHRGHGHARAALAALLPIAYGRDDLDLARLEAIAAVDNIASRRVLEANGFRHEGTLRALLVINGQRVDHALYGLLRTEWEAA